MISSYGEKFLTRLFLNNYKIEGQIQSLGYSERVEIALDLQTMIKQLVSGIKDESGEELHSSIIIESK